MGEINYKETWYMDIPKGKDWETFVWLCDKLGIGLSGTHPDDTWNYLTPCYGTDSVNRSNGSYGYKKVSLLEAIASLVGMQETEQQKQVRELEETINKAKAQIERIKENISK